MAARSSSIVRRALLYVPSSSEKMLAKSLGLKSDNVTYDLEDSVTPSLKTQARGQLRSFLEKNASRPPSISELAVRINAVETKYALDDLASLGALPSVDAVVVPKVNSAADLTYVTDVLRHVAPERHATGSQNPIKIIALVESARSIMNLPEICKASPYLSGLVFAAEDFALDLSLTRTPSLTEFLYARSAIVTAARASGLPSAIDLVCTSFRGDEGLKRLKEESLGGKSMGFNGKQCIHPNQVALVQKLFAPGEKEVEWAVRVAIADEKASKAGRGAWTLDGMMIDAPVTGKANAIIARAEKCDVDVASLQQKWEGQEPE
ncbi:Citrate lyase subunit beta-like protein, mitochondrial [Colletotrichum tanaceti]|uniref:Citrate lyase subunit beta-like protein, mitochondrial n=1 Tax=Colletotrichum tanaceti TaxID=1306861 RepID=A0A4U6XI70_9PEZI|nr:Citrate lyase subunit beta-like protein, mitochondrial [Colletotrichum tanaceti]TKW55640.1 Citrate lyase subunit beta-like protein, mitochondrial [Colletotrichum tanaceti]